MTWSDEEQERELREIWQLLKLHAPTLKERYGIHRIGLFGSWIEGKAQRWSDVDILVEWPDADLYRYVDLKEFLEGIFGRKVDLVLQDRLRSEWKDWILSTVKYAA